MINTHGYGTGCGHGMGTNGPVPNCKVCNPYAPTEKKSFDLDAFHREQMRLTMTKVEDMRGKLQYCMKQIFEMKSRIDWLIEEIKKNENP